jgi:hypothetical protein
MWKWYIPLNNKIVIERYISPTVIFHTTAKLIFLNSIFITHLQLIHHRTMGKKNSSQKKGCLKSSFSGITSRTVRKSKTFPDPGMVFSSFWRFQLQFSSYVWCLYSNVLDCNWLLGRLFIFKLHSFSDHQWLHHTHSWDDKESRISHLLAPPTILVLQDIHNFNKTYMPIHKIICKYETFQFTVKKIIKNKTVLNSWLVQSYELMHIPTILYAAQCSYDQYKIYSLCENKQQKFIWHCTLSYILKI